MPTLTLWVGLASGSIAAYRIMTTKKIELIPTRKSISEICMMQEIKIVGHTSKSEASFLWLRFHVAMAVNSPCPWAQSF